MTGPAVVGTVPCPAMESGEGANPVVPTWWKPYTDMEVLKRDRGNGDLILAEEVQREMKAAGWNYENVVGAPIINEPCEGCGRPVHYVAEEIGGHMGWWMWIGYHSMGDAYVPHNAEDCKMIKDTDAG